MKKIFYEVVIVRTSDDNQNGSYFTALSTPDKNHAVKFAEATRRNHPEFAFIVLESHIKNNDEYKDIFEHDFESKDNPMIIEHY